MAAKSAIALFACAFATFTVGAQPTAQVLPQARDLSFLQLDRAEAMAGHGHPNELWRYRALRALKLDQPERALQNFSSAAKYGDKFSQHALSLMHWHGIGTVVDRAQAYVWADLAAERGYRDLLLVREKMWLGMNAAQRGQALLLGEALYAQYGDAAAKPRMEWAMRRALASATGSRLGFSIDRVEFMNHGAIANLGLSARDYYAEQRWDTKTYWREQDRQWRAKVIVLPPEQLPDQPATDGAPEVGKP